VCEPTFRRKKATLITTAARTSNPLKRFHLSVWRPSPKIPVDTCMSLMIYWLDYSNYSLNILQVGHRTVVCICLARTPLKYWDRASVNTVWDGHQNILKWKTDLAQVPKQVTCTTFLFAEFEVDTRIRYLSLEFCGARGSKNEHFFSCKLSHNTLVLS
jgi:hypothetical protein